MDKLSLYLKRWLISKGIVLCFIVGALGLLKFLHMPLFNEQIDLQIFRLSILLLLINLLYLYPWFRFDRKHAYLTILTYLQFSIDIIFCGMLISATQQLDSPFLFLYSLYVLIGAVILSGEGAWFNALLGIANIVVITLTAILSLSFDRLSNDSGLLIRELIIKGLLHSGSLSIIALSSSYLSEQLKKTSHSLDETQRDLESKENDFKALQQLHHRIIEEMNMGLLFCNAEDQILIFNQKATAILGLSSSQLLGFRLSDCLQSSSLEQKIEASISWEYTRHSDQKKILLEGQRSAYENKAWIFVFQDITEKKRIEAVLIKEQHLAKIGELAAQIAHEIRNPLTAMSNGIELLKTQQLSLEKNQKLISIIDQEIQRLNSLISDFLKYAKPQAVARQRLKATMVLEELQALLQNISPQGLTLSPFDPSLGEQVIEVDLNSLKQIFLNLINNSIEANSVKIEISAQILPAPLATVINTSSNILQNPLKASSSSTLQILVQDDGDGFKADQKQLFEPFFTTKTKGSGLGLAISLKLIKANDGDLCLLPSKQGCLFAVYLPILNEQKESVQDVSS